MLELPGLAPHRSHSVVYFEQRCWATLTALYYGEKKVAFHYCFSSTYLHRRALSLPAQETRILVLGLPSSEDFERLWDSSTLPGW